MTLSQYIKQEASTLGFSACGIAKIESAESESPYLDQWLSYGYQAGMHYMENNRDVRIYPSKLLDGAKSIISVALNYYPQQQLSPELPHIAYYAYGKDYHIVVKRMLNQLWEKIVEKSPKKEAKARCFTDSAPILERYWAWKAGLGWIGKNTQLIIPRKGSFFFLGEIITTLDLDYDTPQQERCGNCHRCLDACPAGALESARLLNANKCISYLTIENREDIPIQQAKLLGNRLYGCDTCQIVCPWNRFATGTNIKDFQPSADLLSFRKEDLKNFSHEDYLRIFKGSAAKRAKYEGFVRTINILNHTSCKKDH